MNDPEAFKTRWAGIFSRAASAYDRTGPQGPSYFGRMLVDFARLPPGARVLDVACGKGAVFTPASAAVGPSGEVIGIDLSEGMIKEARALIDRLGLANTTVVRMDAESLEFPDGYFDSVLCGLCLFFFPDVDRSLVECLRVLKPRGQLAATTFQAVDDERTRRWMAFRETFKDDLGPAVVLPTKDLNTEAEMREVFSRAGFEAIEVMPYEETFYFANEDEWWEYLWSAGMRGFLERLNEPALARFRQGAIKLVQQEKTPQGIPDKWAMLFTRGQKPA